MSHINKIIDADPHFNIDTVTRRIKNESSEKVTLIQGDHNSERFTFELPRFIEGHDTLECNCVVIHFKNETWEDTYHVDDVQIHPDKPDTIAFSWLLSENATMNEGKLDFAIRFACVDDDGNVEYSWGTSICSFITITKGLNHNKDISERYPDILAQLAAKIDNIGGTVDDSRIEEVYGELRNMIDQLDSQVNTATTNLTFEKIAKWTKGVLYPPNVNIVTTLSDGGLSLLRVGSDPITATKDFPDQESFYGTKITNVFSTLSTTELESALDRILTKYGLDGDSE